MPPRQQPRREQSTNRSSPTTAPTPSRNRRPRRAELTDAEREAVRAADRQRHRIRLQDERIAERRRE